jgi:hypothetical protein
MRVCSAQHMFSAVLAQASEDLNVKLWDTRIPGVLKFSSKLDGYIYFPVSATCVTVSTLPCSFILFYLFVQLCVDVSPDGMYLLTSSKGFNSVGAEARVRCCVPARTSTQPVSRRFVLSCSCGTCVR